ncbi:lytic transglycosylase domain-containing protein [Phenylobacterium sp.]|uniref:lytic transglycosylase domain-containing protein n=1 Tax=Phenylobacterium sp. TaxID=1871053 RepID=UPI003BB5CC0E
MALSLAAALALAAHCAPTVAPETLLSVVEVESRFEPLAIGVNGAPPIVVSANSINEAVARAGALIAGGRSVDLGLAQINSRNLSWLGLSLRDVFEPCANLRAAARILKAGYARSDAVRVGEQAAIQTALSYYNTGHPVRGFRNGYVSRVADAAARIVPAIGGATTAGPTLSLTEVEPEIPPPAWDVFGEVSHGQRHFVTTLSTAAPGGPQ